MNGPPEALRVFVYALLTALATGLIALPFGVVKNASWVSATRSLPG